MLCLLAVLTTSCASSPAYEDSSGFVPDWGPVEPRRIGAQAAPSEDLPPQEPREDEAIRQDLLLSLFADPGVDVFDYRIRVDSGKVTLRGRSGGEAEKNRAGQLAGSVPGVAEVRNELEPESVSRLDSQPHGTPGIQEGQSVILSIQPGHPGLTRTSIDKPTSVR
jgi:hypothetical protein